MVADDCPAVGCQVVVHDEALPPGARRREGAHGRAAPDGQRLLLGLLARLDRPRQT